MISEIYTASAYIELFILCKQESTRLYKSETVINKAFGGAIETFDYYKEATFSIRPYNREWCLITIEQHYHEVNYPKNYTALEGLVWELLKAYEKIQVVIDKTGNLQALENYDFICKNWGKVKREVLKYFEGNFVNDYLENLEKIILNPRLLRRELLSPRNWGLFFPQFCRNRVSQGVFFRNEQEVEADSFKKALIVQDFALYENDTPSEAIIKVSGKHKEPVGEDAAVKDFRSTIVINKEDGLVKSQQLRYQSTSKNDDTLYNHSYNLELSGS